MTDTLDDLRLLAKLAYRRTRRFAFDVTDRVLRVVPYLLAHRG